MPRTSSLKEFDVLHQQVKKTSRIEESESAYAVYREKEWSKKYRRWRYTYEILPPKGRKLFLSDNVIIDMLRHLPGIKLKEILRDKEFDRFFVFQARRGVFSTRASRTARTARKRFLAKLGKAASLERAPRRVAMEAVERFRAEHGFTYVEWTGKMVIAYKMGSLGYERYESTARNKGPYRVALEKLHHVCAIEPPFSLGAVPL